MKCFLLLAIVSSLHAAMQPALMPQPASVIFRDGEMRIENGFHVSTSAYADAKLSRAVDRFTDQLSRQSGVPFLPGFAGASLVIECAGKAPEYPQLGEDESYHLQVDTSGARLSARTTTGVLRGLSTLLQLAGAGEHGMRIPAVDIEDHPRFPWRGVMLDVSRHWMPLPVVLRNLDAMAAVKFNVFHWHLSDDQGFRVESKRFPKLQQLGSDGHYYTQEQVREVVEYARDRGIRVIPEFDTPGHTTSWFVGYPELASAPGPYSIERTWGIFQPTMDPSRESTFTFLDGFIGEMAALFPDPFFHIGGDEVDDTQWKTSASIRDFSQSRYFQSSPELHAYFNTRLQAILKKHGKTLIGWDEILSPALDPNAVIQSWRGADAVNDAARQGHRTLLSAGYYLDHLLPASTHYAADPLANAAGLSPAEAARVLGGELCMWAEYVSPETVDSRLWPRAAAIAERFWSAADVRDVESMYTRMQQVSRVLEFSGAEHRSNLGPMLDRLAGWRNAAPLYVLVDSLEALGIAGRRDERKYSSPVPLNRIVDAARPESEAMRALTRSAEAWLVARDPDTGAHLTQTFKEWETTASQVRSLAVQNALLEEAVPLAVNLAATGTIGAQALDYLQRREMPPAAWLQSSTLALDEYEKPKAETRLAAVRPVRVLLNALRPVQAGVSH